MLGHPEPHTRIAEWVRDVFSNLCQALNESSDQISNANVATAIMLASLQIIAPNTFEVEISWQQHLSIARSMIMARGGPRAVNRTKDRVSYFLIRWFAYLDVLGAFSTKADQALFTGDLYDFEDDAHDFQIDCVLGFSGYLAGILAKIADLARRCDNERVTSTGELDPSWTPAPDVLLAAERIKSDLQAAGHQRYSLCPHRQKNSDIEASYQALEMSATNEAFHWAGIIHLHKRVLGLPQEAPEVQNAVRSVIGTLYKVRKGGAAEACLIFPLFTAGCEAKEESQREIIMERIMSVEASGMAQVCNRHFFV